MIEQHPVGGGTAPGFEAVREAFARNFTERGELGAAFAAYRDGRPVVELWHGLADRRSGRPWDQDTLAVVFSGTKGLVAVCLLMLIERGQLDLDAPVGRYWPELATGEKRKTLVRHLVSHQAGLPGLRRALAEEDILDPRQMARMLEAEAPFWPPGERLCYHPLTFGWLCGELIRRIAGRTVGAFFRQEVAEPLGLEAWIGLPQELEGRVATLAPGADWGTSSAHTLSSGDPLVAYVWDNPHDRHAEPLRQNTRAFHAAEIPGAGAIVSARSMARLHACLACGGVLDGVQLLRSETIDLGRTCIARGVDALLGGPTAFGVGFELQTELETLGPPRTAFGHTGAGGSTHGAWPEQRVGFSYVMNELRDAEPDARAQALLTALYEAVERP